jgi:hypothetical protein
MFFRGYLIRKNVGKSEPAGNEEDAHFADESQLFGEVHVGELSPSYRVGIVIFLLACHIPLHPV